MTEFLRGVPITSNYVKQLLKLVASQKAELQECSYNYADYINSRHIIAIELGLEKLNSKSNLSDLLIKRLGANATQCPKCTETDRSNAEKLQQCQTELENYKISFQSDTRIGNWEQYLRQMTKSKEEILEIITNLRNELEIISTLTEPEYTKLVQLHSALISSLDQVDPVLLAIGAKLNTFEGITTLYSYVKSENIFNKTLKEQLAHVKKYLQNFKLPPTIVYQETNKCIEWFHKLLTCLDIDFAITTLNEVTINSLCLYIQNNVKFDKQKNWEFKAYQLETRSITNTLFTKIVLECAPTSNKFDNFNRDVDNEKLVLFDEINANLFVRTINNSLNECFIQLENLRSKNIEFNAANATLQETKTSYEQQQIVTIELQQQIFEMTQTIIQLQNQVTNLERDRINLFDEKNDLETQMSESNRQNSRMKSEIFTMKGDIDNLQTQIITLQNLNKTLEVNRNENTILAQRYMREKNEVQITVQSIKSELVTTKQFLNLWFNTDDLKSIETRLNDYCSQNKTVFECINNYKKLIDELKAANVQANIDLDEALQQCQNYKSCETIQRQNTELLEDLKNQKLLNIKLQDTIEVFQMEKNDYEQVNTNTLREITELKTKNVDLETRILDMIQFLSTAENDAKKCQTQLAYVKQRNATLIQRLPKISETREIINNLKAKIRELEIENFNLVHRVSNRVARVVPKKRVKLDVETVSQNTEPYNVSATTNSAFDEDKLLVFEDLQKIQQEQEMKNFQNISSP